MPLSTASTSAKPTSRSALGFFGEHHREKYKREIVEYYRANLELMRALANAYGFALHVFYQPIGILDNTNPFVSARARGAPGYRYISELVDVARAAVASGDLPMVDISQALNHVPGRAISTLPTTLQKPMRRWPGPSQVISGSDEVGRPANLGENAIMQHAGSHGSRARSTSEEPGGRSATTLAITHRNLHVIKARGHSSFAHCQR